MRELSLHILDVVQNSIKAKATIVEIRIVENLKADRMSIEIKDNGTGMSPGLLEKVTDPFITTRKNRSVGLGLSLFKSTARQCEGDLLVESKEGAGTSVYTTLRHSHIDRPPLGNMEETFITLLIYADENKKGYGKIQYVYQHQINNQSIVFDTREIKKTIGATPINDNEVLDRIKNYLKENLETLVKKQNIL